MNNPTGLSCTTSTVPSVPSVPSCALGPFCHCRETALRQEHRCLYCHRPLHPPTSEQFNCSETVNGSTFCCLSFPHIAKFCFEINGRLLLEDGTVPERPNSKLPAAHSRLMDGALEAPKGRMRTQLHGNAPHQHDVYLSLSNETPANEPWAWASADVVVMKDYDLAAGKAVHNIWDGNNVTEAMCGTHCSSLWFVRHSGGKSSTFPPCSSTLFPTAGDTH
jgi:hypothetical protein